METKNYSEMENTETEMVGDGDFFKAYIRLRTVLDSLEQTALRYCLADTNSRVRKQRAEEISDLLIPIIHKLERRINPGVELGCPDGYYDCGGICVAYRCPILDNQSEKETV